MSLLVKPTKRPNFSIFGGNDKLIRGEMIQLEGKVFINDIDVEKSLEKMEEAYQKLSCLTLDLEKVEEEPEVLLKTLLTNKKKILFFQQQIIALQKNQVICKKKLLEYL